MVFHSLSSRHWYFKQFASKQQFEKSQKKIFLVCFCFFFLFFCFCFSNSFESLPLILLIIQWILSFFFCLLSFLQLCTESCFLILVSVSCIVIIFYITLFLSVVGVSKANPFYFNLLATNQAQLLCPSFFSSVIFTTHSQTCCPFFICKYFLSFRSYNVITVMNPF